MKRMLFAVLIAALAGTRAGAQADDPFTRYLYPPDLVLDNQRQIGLMPAERVKIQEAVLDAQKKLVGLQFVMSQESEKLKDLLRGAIVEEAAVLKQIDTMLGVEREVKRAQLSLMIKIKNILSVDQKAMLDKIRNR